MSSLTRTGAGGAPAPPGAKAANMPSLLLRMGVLAFIDAITIWLVYGFLADGNFFLAIVLAAVTVWLNVVFLSERYYPLRWISPGMALMALMVVYPILFTVGVSFTNYGSGHLVTKQLAIRQIEAQTYLAADSPIYSWAAYQNAAGDYLLWLTDPDTGAAFTVAPGDEPVERSGDPPAQMDGYTQIPMNQIFPHLGPLSALVFGVPPDSAFRVSQQVMGQAAQYEQKYVYDAAQDAMIDQETGAVFRNVNGTFTSDSGQTLSPGFASTRGVYNYVRLATDAGLRSTFLGVFVWTIIFATLSVLLTFSLGMFLAINFDVPEMPFKRTLRTLLLIPYTIPAFVAVPVWVGLLNPQFGVISAGIRNLLGVAPPWFSDPYWAKAGILLIQLWLGFPYMFVVITGALQTLPPDIYEAADLDGAGPWAKFRRITLPLLLITVGPLLVASFAFNFNNFTVIDLYSQGGPPIPNVPTPVGHTDILATYTYRIAFGSTGVSDYGYASAITVMIFIMLIIITMFQFRFTTMLEERGENV
ncbi:MAG: ABC transporter permease subunit [Chloroflexota bacterium]|nr:ABC transporter permease subunit [Chloroflexota bacterium]